VTGQLHRTTRENMTYYTAEESFSPLIAHLRVVTARVSRRERQALLCAPTHQGGWIGPLAWVDRLHALQSAGLAESMDFRLFAVAAGARSSDRGARRAGRTGRAAAADRELRAWRGRRPEPRRPCGLDHRGAVPWAARQLE